MAVVDMLQSDAAQVFTRSLKETGFAVLQNHGIDEDRVQGIYGEWKDFLMSLHEARTAAVMTPEQKSLLDAYAFSVDHQDGYFGMDVSETAKGSTMKDIKHFYQCYFPWGRYPDKVSDDARLLHAEFLALGRKLLSWIQDETTATLRYELPDIIGAEQTMLRVLHYPAYSTDDVKPGAIRAAAHEDINLLTLLPAGTATGLQLKLHGVWYNVPLLRGTLIVNIGDMLQEATGYEYKSTTHRVIKPADADDSADRMSIPCFIHPKPDTYLSNRYPTAKQFLDERLREIGVRP